MMDDSRNTLGNNIRKFRIQNNMTQEALGKLLGVEKTAVSKWERGITLANDYLPQLSNIFNVSADELLGSPTKKRDLEKLRVGLEYVCTQEFLSRDFVFFDIFKNTFDDSYEVWVYDAHYSGVKIMVAKYPLKNRTANSLAKEIQDNRAQFIKIFRDAAIASDDEERQKLEQYESFCDFMDTID